MKYIKLFKTLADYNAFTAEDTFVMPNASYIIEEFGSRYTPLPLPPKVTLKYNCPADNLYAFSKGVQNVKKLTVDGNNVDFEPLQQNNYTIDILSSNISKVTDGGYIVPENYFILHPPTSLAIKLADATSVLDIDNFFLLQLFTGPGMESVMGIPMPLSEYIESGMLILNDNNSISFGQDQLTEINTVVNMPGYKVTYCFTDTNISLIDTVIEYEGTTGGIPLPYSFETPGQHTVELELFDGQFGAIRMFSEFPPNSDDASLTSVTLNESISLIHNGTFICDNLKHITCKSKKAPILEQNADGETDINVPYFGTLVYPKGSDYSSWLDVNNGFGMYGWNQEPPVITCTYNVTDISTPTKICNELSDYNGNYFNSITVDGVLMTNQSTEVTFTTVQEHIVTFKLAQMDIPASVFRNCYNLTKVSISSNSNKIGYSAFYNCSGLTSIVIPDSVTSIDNSAFYNCSGLTSIVIPDSVTYIGDSAFDSCTKLTSINIPDSVTSIGYSAFYDCSGLTSIVIPDSVTTIGYSAFKNCSSLTSIVIPDSVTNIGNYAFENCSSLKGIRIPDGVTSIGEWAFAGCSGLTGELVIPNSVTSIEYSAFRNCSDLTSLTLGLGVTTIGQSAFHGCSGLTGELVIPDSVTEIGELAFYDCYGITDLTIGSGLKSVSGLYQYASLSSITVSSGNSFYDSRENCNCIIETASNKLVFGSNNSFIPDSVTEIGDAAFYNCSNLTSIVIPDSVTSIGQGAFYNCSGLTSINIPDGVTSINNQTFENCSGLTDITIGTGVISIGQSAFKFCRALTSIVIPDSVTSIGDYGFHYCDGLTSITCLASTAPSTQPTTFDAVKYGGTLYYPAGSDYSSWLSRLPSSWTGQTI